MDGFFSPRSERNSLPMRIAEAARIAMALAG